MARVYLNNVTQVKKSGDNVYIFQNAITDAEGGSGVTALPIGHMFKWPFATPPDGSIVVNGAEYSRELYADLWDYVSVHDSWLKTESEWQEIAAQNNGYCPFYSDGNGTTTFRVPKFAPFAQVANDSGSAGSYHKAGMPNITWNITPTSASAYELFASDALLTNGAVEVEYGPATSLATTTSLGQNNVINIKSDASLSSPVFGRSNTVQPESNEWIVCVVAYGRATNVGNVDVANVMSAVGTVQSNLTNYLTTTDGVVNGRINFNLYGTDDRIGEIVALNDQYGKRLVVDTYEEGDAGAFLNLFKGSSEIKPGGFELCVRNAEDSVIKILEARTDGNLWWDGKQIVRSVNGVLADSNGNARALESVWIGDSSGGFTMPWDGFVIGSFAGGNGQKFRIYRNDKEILYARQADQGYGTLRFPFCIAAYAGERISAEKKAWYGVRAVRK